MKAHLRIQQFELTLTGGSGRIVTAEASGDENVRKALGAVGRAMAGEPIDWMDEASLSRVITHAPAPRARRLDPQTSHDAAERAVRLKKAHERKITEWLRAHIAGGTKYEISAGTGLDAIAVARRMKELRETAGVYDSGERRDTPTGRKATVWKIR